MGKKQRNGNSDKPMLVSVYVASWQEEGEEPYEIRSDECKPKEKASDSDWWFDEESLMFRRYWSYHHELYGNQYVHDEVNAVLLNQPHPLKSKHNDNRKNSQSMV